MIQEIKVPDLGTEEADVVEVLVAAGDTVAVDDPLLTLESDKASMDMPSEAAGTVKEVKVSAGDKVQEGTVVFLLEVEEGAAASAEKKQPAAEAPSKEPPKPAEAEPEAQEREAETPEKPAAAPAPRTPEPGPVAEEGFAKAHASPGVRRLARKLGVDLGQVPGTGRKGRITEDDLHGWVQGAMAGGGTGGGLAVAPMPSFDFSKWGPVESKPLSRIRRVAARNLHRSWVTVPHVTQHDEADATEMEAFRKAHAEEAKARGVKLTPVAFLLKASARALQEFPDFNSSLDPSGESLVVKKYLHIGVAVDTPDGLVVPVVRDVGTKGLYQLAGDLGTLSGKAREGKLMPAEMQGACFTISSLGGIGGTAFTPIVNAPEVAILGVSRSKMTPVWNGAEFTPRLMLPLSLSYDHRVIDGAAAARFITHLSGLLSDLRRLLL